MDLSIFDLAGRRVRRLVSGPTGAGEHVAQWNGRDETGGRVPAGVYLYRLRTPGNAETRRVVVIE